MIGKSKHGYGMIWKLSNRCRYLEKLASPAQGPELLRNLAIEGKKTASIGDLLKRLCSNAGDTFCVMYLVNALSGAIPWTFARPLVLTFQAASVSEWLRITLYSSYGS